MTVTNALESMTMLRREPARATTVSDWELGLAAVVLLVVVVLASLFVPSFV